MLTIISSDDYWWFKESYILNGKVDTDVMKHTAFHQLKMEKKVQFNSEEVARR